MGQKVEDDDISQKKFDEYVFMCTRNGMRIETLEGGHTASIGDYIIKGIKGEYYPCKPDIFDQTYEPVI